MPIKKKYCWISGMKNSDKTEQKMLSEAITKIEGKKWLILWNEEDLNINSLEW